MKLRQKLAMVLATAMIVTAVPVTTMAAQSMGLNKPAYTFIAENLITTDAGLAITLKYDQQITESDKEYITVTAEDFKFSQADYDYIKANLNQYPNITSIEWVSETEIEVGVITTGNDNKVNIPLAGTPSKGTPVISVKGTNYTEAGKITLGELESTKALVATAGKVQNINVDGEGVLGDINIDEKVAGSLQGDVLEVKLPNSSDLVFVEDTVKLIGKKGLTIGGQATAEVKAEFLQLTTDKEDNKVLRIDLSGVDKSVARAGSLVVSGIKVAPENPKEDVKKGDVVVAVKAFNGKTTILDSTSLKVAEIVEEEISLGVKEEVTLTAGHGTETVEISVNEATAGTINKTVYLSVDGAEIVGFEDEAAAKAAGFKMGKENKEILFNVENTTEKEHKVKVVLRAKADTTGEVTLHATSKQLEEDATKTIGKVEAPFTVETKGFNVQPGIKEQKGGKIVITEAEAGKFTRNQEFRIKSEDEELSIKDAKVETTGDVKVESEVKDGEIIIKVTRASDETSEIIITDMEVNAKKYLAEGNYDFLVGGTAVADANAIEGKNTDSYKDKLTLKDFVRVGDELAGGEAAFKVGEKTFILNGETVEMDVAAYISAKNRVMIPVRFLSEAFGIAPQDIKFDQPTGTVTMFMDGKVVQLVNGEAQVLINGVKVPMEEAMTIKDDRSFVPMGELARILDIEVEWNNETKTATFKN